MLSVYKIMCIFNLNAMFFINFQHYYMLYFCSPASCNKIIVGFSLLHVLLYILSTRLSEIHAHVLLMHVHSSSFITCSFLLTVNDCERIPFLLMFRDNGHNTPYTVPSGGLLWLTGFTWLLQGHRQKLCTSVCSLGYGEMVGRLSYNERQQHHQCLRANKLNAPSFGQLPPPPPKKKKEEKCMGYLRK
jgi:hypothetical protein